MQLDMSDYSTQAKYAKEVNDGYTSNLFGVKECHYTCPLRKQAFEYGWQQAQRHLSGK